MSRFITCEHHGCLVSVREGLKGKHHEHCLCYSCDLFKPGLPVNCAVAEMVFINCVENGIVTPVWECPRFVEDKLAIKK
jgi:hypothetical protein